MIEDVRYKHLQREPRKFVVKGCDVLLKVFLGEKKIGSIIVQTNKDRDAMAAEEGEIVQMGMNAFEELHQDERYNVGDKVAITRYSGKSLGLTDNPDYEYRCIQDTGIHALIIENEAKDV